jgi:hypothetical protein
LRTSEPDEEERRVSTDNHPEAPDQLALVIDDADPRSEIGNVAADRGRAPDDTMFLTDDGGHFVRKLTLDGKVLLELGVPGKPAPYMSGEPFHRCTHTALSRVPLGRLGVLGHLVFSADRWTFSRRHFADPNKSARSAVALCAS